MLELATRAARARRAYLRDYWDPAYVAQIITAPRELVESRRASGWAAHDLSAHYNKVCLETTLGMLRASWAAAIAETRRRVLASGRLSSRQQLLAVQILNSPDRIRLCLTGRGVADQNDLTSRWLRRTLIKVRGRFPAASRRHWFDLDCNLYRPFIRADDKKFRGAWLAVTGLAPGRRVKIPLAGVGILEFDSRTGRHWSRPNVRVEVGERIVFRVLMYEGIRQRNGTLRAGVDKGYKTLVTMTTGDPEAAVGYGVGADALIDRVNERAEARLLGRRRLASYERSLRNASQAKALRMRRHNLHARKVRCAARRDRTTLRQEVNTALNTLFRENPVIASIAVENLRFRGRAPNRSLNRRLARWLKGYIDARLRYKAELNGVELKVVSAAYTSQACPYCWFASADNRSGDRFVCGDCGYTGSADAVAATNIRRRGSDPAITQFTPLVAVKQILDERWRSARNGRAWGSNSGAPGSDELGHVSLGQSREQRAASQPRRPYGGALSAPSRSRVTDEPVLGDSGGRA